MFGNTNDIRSKTEETSKSEACYGGFGRRFSYEECRGTSGGSRLMRILSKLALGTAMCMFFGLLGTLCGVLMFHIVSENRALYYPNGVSLESQSDVETAEKMRETSPSRHTASNISVIRNTVSAENVTAEQSSRYRVPVGVMVHDVTENSAPHIAGLKTGDIIVELDGHAVSDIEALCEALAANVGKNVPVTLFRENVYVKIYIDIE